MNQFLLVLNQLFQFFIMMATGYLAAKTAVASKPFLDGLAKLILRVLMPILIFANATNRTNRTQLLECFPILYLSIGMYAGLVLTFFLVAKAAGLKGEQNRVFRASMIFGNAGFIGIPLLLAVFPEKGGIYITLMSLVDQTFLWTYGLQLTTPKSEKTAFNPENFLNPALCAVGLALVLLLLNIPVSPVVDAPLLSIGKAATPLSLIYLGGLLY
ncbi:MAG: permease, partial [Ruminococcaceae bacterium]|nr:permease [Oscillospiraceae bacterium]